ncbi:HyaD/HybD family hydrogenase maturation endopeptidase [Campylobacter californiensis]|uniref:HyaD/HybD family hydrogenase maturation endopeptidase n=1 Tax=Campylobacter californiensis TaxID=1032243 RepID=UPI001473E871|nr:HyaD/HybD family hydrogenase maturation endopeptidase [Campylobacter sp. RM12916]MBE3609262.1 HyaD/HybD family hydrogenase maturation endopeptidase [Campylobacter sp. RM12916]
MKFLLLGIGNVMFGDEGFGVHFIKWVERNYRFTSKEHLLEFIDGGTLAMALTPVISEFDSIVMVDCIEANDSKVGEIYFFDYENIPEFIKFDGSAHEVEMKQTLAYMDILGDRPEVKILGLIPKRIEPMSFELSSQLINGANVALNALLNYLLKCGFEYEKIDNLSIQDIANEYKKKGFYGSSF